MLRVTLFSLSQSMGLQYLVQGRLHGIHLKMQETQNSYINLEKESQIEALTFPNFFTYHKAPAVKTVWDWHMDRHMTNGIELKAKKQALTFIVS